MVKRLAMSACKTGILALTMIACAEDDADNRANLSQREKDSILAGSQIPGARAVKKSMSSADSATARQNRLDSAEREP
jgi:hypothetical protein